MGRFLSWQSHSTNARINVEFTAARDFALASQERLTAEVTALTHTSDDAGTTSTDVVTDLRVTGRFDSLPEDGDHAAVTELDAILGDQSATALADQMPVDDPHSGEREARTAALTALAVGDHIAAFATLDEVIATAHATLADSDGRVTDAQIRFDLTDAINTAVTALDAAVDQSDNAALTKSTTGLNAQTDALNTVVGTVNCSVAAWEQAEAARSAATARARAAASASGSSGGTRGTMGSTGKGTGGGSGGTGTGCGNAPLPRLGGNPRPSFGTGNAPE